MRIIEGALVVIVSFIFIVQSSTTIDLWLNFAAVQFVGMLDESVFHLAEGRFLGTTAKKLANRVSEYELFSERKQHSKRVRMLRIVVFVGLLLGMWAGLSVFVYNQSQSTYACSSITISMGENRLQYARHFSGSYIIQEKRINQRAVYVQEQGRGAFLAYCAADGINRWTLSSLGPDEEPQDPCKKIELVCCV